MIQVTVRELIETLEEYPMDLPVVTDYREIDEVSVDDSFYFLDHSEQHYHVAPAVVLE